MKVNNETYYYIYNGQNDVVSLIDSDGEWVVIYEYNSWGLPLGIEDNSGAGIASKTPFRYRGYCYDEEPGFYYVSSRYYDPEVGRFLSADSTISGVGGDIRGYNLYSYCMNNPVNMSDPDGNWPKWVQRIGNKVKKTVSKVKNKVKSVVKKVKQDVKDFRINNTSEKKVLESNYVSAYKNTIVIKIPGSSGVSFGVIDVGNKTTSTNLVKHEYGHRLQLENMGVINYTTDIAIPSVTANLLQRMGKLPYDYYGSPWEAGADELGGVHRTYDNTPWPEEACDSYGDLIR